jgi:methyl-accepting chemotaxis protein
VKKIKEGSELVGVTNKAFGQVAESALRWVSWWPRSMPPPMSRRRVWTRSNKAVAEMDKVTQSNASNAEESAAASEEMNAQAEQMKAVVRDLIAVVGGSGNETNGYNVASAQGCPVVVGQGDIEFQPGFQGQESAVQGGKKMIAHGTVVKPEQVLPLDEEFSDF